MSQQTNSGFNAPGFPVVSDDPAMACPRIAASPAELPASFFPSAAGARLVGVGHKAIACAFKSGDFPRSTSVLAPSGVRTALSASVAVGVGHSAAATCLGNWSIRLLPSARCAVIPGESFQSRALGVTHKPHSVASVGRVDGISWNNRRFAGVSLAFQVSKHSVEPMLANRRCNLFAHDDGGATLADESKKVGP